MPEKRSRRFCELVSLATILALCRLPRQLKSERSLPKAATIEGPARQTGKAARLDLFGFVPFRLNRLAAEVSNALSDEYQARYGLDIPGGGGGGGRGALWRP